MGNKLMLFFFVELVVTIAAYTTWDYNGIVGSGQSLSVGAQSSATSTSQPFQNLKLSRSGNWPVSVTDSSLQLIPLTEQSNSNGYPSPYPKNLYGETPHSAMANSITSHNSGFVSVHTVVGESGQGMAQLKKGAQDTGTTGRAYAATLFEVEAITNLAKKAGKTYGVNGLIFTHGETDSGSSTYEREIGELYSNYSQDFKRLTGQSSDYLFIISQQHAYGSTAGNAISTSTLAAWHAAQSNSNIICIPKYQYTYYSDGVHEDAHGYQTLGEKYGEIYEEVVIKGNNWKTLEPTGVTRSGSAINVAFSVPNPPLQWDSSLPNPSASSEWSQGKGFEVTHNNQTKLQIQSVAIEGSSVIINVNSIPSSGQIRVGYAATAQNKRSNGTVRWGLLKDSDNYTGYATKQAQQNFAVSFEIYLTL